MKKLIRNMAISAGLLGTTYFANENLDLYDKILHEITDQGPVDITVKNIFFGRHGNRCSLAFRENAEEHGYKTNPAPAHSLKYNNKVTFKNLNEKYLRELFSENKVKQWDGVTLYNPSSKFNEGLDNQGNKKGNTHVASYIGTRNGKPLFAHQHAYKTKINTLEELTEMGFSPVEVIKAQDQ
jgi:hypothetical protein